jgi:hypothetical protein
MYLFAPPPRTILESKHTDRYFWLQEDYHVPGFVLTSFFLGLNWPPLVITRCVIKRYGFMNCSKRRSVIDPHWWSERADPMKDSPSPTLCMVRDRKLLGKLIGAVVRWIKVCWKFSHLQMVWNKSKTEWRGACGVKGWICFVKSLKCTLKCHFWCCTWI